MSFMRFEKHIYLKFKNFINYYQIISSKDFLEKEKSKQKKLNFI